MKKNLLLFLILIFTFLSCSSNDSDNTEDDTTILPKAIISIYPGFSSDTALFSYDKNKIKSISYKKDKIYYHYEDNVIVGKTYYNIVQGKEVKINEETYSYTNGRLASIKYLDNWASSPRKINIRSVYTYLSDTLVKEQRFSTDYLTKIEAEDDYFSLLKIKNGNLIKRDYVKTKTGITSYTYTYVYDNMNSPFKNITGMSLLINDEESSFNNRLSSFSVDSSDYLDIKDYKYDMKGYPILETYYKGGKQVTAITKYLY
ncbi:hypothetical protein DBB36_20455 [Flavobacterium sp. WLB]|uniref:hypothetical protein n=1 Tax=unclassified Flavobacterium TaxID=196869 RepID=UPI0006ABB290|nr:MULTISPECIES: hypothetical protein [unclassified Flavobacterium]KOP39587.1 hypothetical protein AKO67_03265 [Flavobacterium sp. VMW]OWU90138.1 hypothetical protein APR43_13745 [Flavobacterium sp. NLM]PUU68121.1 hypothetical protein DBB36_20455 [Flavobacterium sp. WLB]